MTFSCQTRACDSLDPDKKLEKENARVRAAKRLTTDKNKSSVRRKFKVGQIPYDVSIPLPSGKSTQLQVSSTSSVTLIYTENTIHVSLFEVLATSPLFGVKSDCAKLPTHGYGRGRLPVPPSLWAVKVRPNHKFIQKKPS